MGSMLAVLSLAALSLAGLSVGCSGDEGPEQYETSPKKVGERGESCRARNDCAEGLACVRNTCVRNDYPVSAASGQCSLIECTNDEECCELDSQCQGYQSECEDGEQQACDLFDTYCQCTQQCINQQCQNVNSCSDDSDCFDGSCSDGICVQCSSDDECFQDEQCIQGRCETGCRADANCPLFSTCQEGECVETGCENDRECVLFTEDGDATCAEGECIVPCSNDAECNSGGDNYFEVCEEGQCVFVGCESDHECRIALGLANTQSDYRAVCEAGGE
jgi:hypothetical protein